MIARPCSIPEIVATEKTSQNFNLRTTIALTFNEETIHFLNMLNELSNE
jgi:hypothetical protein